MTKHKPGLVRVGDSDLLKAISKELRPTPIKLRIIEAASTDNLQSLLFQHTVFCQTCLPYRDPGDDIRTWERSNGTVVLEVNAGKAMHPSERRLVPLGIPFGPKARMILMHINQQALLTNSPEIEVQDSLTKFVGRTLELDTHGRNMRTVKEQLARLSASSITLGIACDRGAHTQNIHIVTAFDIWFPKDDRQRVLWPSTVRVSLDYFESLKAHAVPVVEAHIAALSHSAMALDLYCWLTQRLHRIPQGKPAFLPWTVLQAQFGMHYGQIRDFRRVFKGVLKQVCCLYDRARVDVDRRGMTAWNSPPVAAPRMHAIS